MFDEQSAYFWAGFFATGMFVGAVSSKALACTIAYCLGLLAVYPDTEKAVMLILLYIPSVLLANFRD